MQFPQFFPLLLSSALHPATVEVCNWNLRFFLLSLSSFLCSSLFISTRDDNCSCNFNLHNFHQNPISFVLFHSQCCELNLQFPFAWSTFRELMKQFYCCLLSHSFKLECIEEQRFVWNLMISKKDDDKEACAWCLIEYDTQSDAEIRQVTILDECTIVSKQDQRKTM